MPKLMQLVVHDNDWRSPHVSITELPFSDMMQYLAQVGLSPILIFRFEESGLTHCLEEGWHILASQDIFALHMSIEELSSLNVNRRAAFFGHDSETSCMFFSCILIRAGECHPSAQRYARKYTCAQAHTPVERSCQETVSVRERANASGEGHQRCAGCAFQEILPSSDKPTLCRFTEHITKAF